jgi:two-component system cell cycle sensor histidine kinase/response regulator CckA
LRFAVTGGGVDRSGSLRRIVTEYGRQTGERVLDELPVGIWVGRASTGEVLYTNAAFRTIVGAEARAGDNIAAVPAAYGLHDRAGNAYSVERLAFSRAAARGEPVVVDDLVIHRRDGSRAWLRAFANPVRDERGAVSHVVVALTDITAEVRAVVDRAEVEKHLSVAIHHAPVLFFVMNRDSVLTVADGALRPILEGGRGGMVGQSLLETYKDHPTVPGFIRRALAGETVTYSIEVRGLNLDVWLGAVRDAAGEIVGAIGVCTDVTEARRLQSRVIQDDRVRAMGTLAASVAHEINNPLTYIFGGLEEAQLELEELSNELRALKASPGADASTAASRRRIDRVRDCLTPVLEGTKRIREVTRELATFSRPNDEVLTPVDVACVLRSVLKLVRKEIEARARLVEEIESGPLVLGNEARLVQVFVNLLMNAWQALPSPEPARHIIGVRTATEAGEAIIDIWDTGPGVAPQLRQQIFEPFVTTKDVGAGTGLGLFVCRNIITSFRGRITVHDAPGGGALFRVTLPLTRATDAPTAARPAGQAAPSRRPRVLIIDDDPLVARALASRLVGELFEVRTALGGRQGLQIILDDVGVDLAYCDVMMSDFTGIDLHDALTLRAPERLSKVVFMTGGAFTGKAQTFVEQRGERHVQKPFDILADTRRRLG